MRIGPAASSRRSPPPVPGARPARPPIGIVFHDGWIYLSHEEKDGTWGISRFRPDTGDAEAVLRGLPGNGDHDVNYLVFDREGSLYFGIGSATNSGVVSSHDPVNQKWLEKRPRDPRRPLQRHGPDRPVLHRPNEPTDNEGDEATTGAYQAYGRSDATPCRRASRSA